MRAVNLQTSQFHQILQGSGNGTTKIVVIQIQETQIGEASILSWNSSRNLVGGEKPFRIIITREWLLDAILRHFFFLSFNLQRIKRGQL